MVAVLSSYYQLSYNKTVRQVNCEMPFFRMSLFLIYFVPFNHDMSLYIETSVYSSCEHFTGYLKFVNNLKLTSEVSCSWLLSQWQILGTGNLPQDSAPVCINIDIFPEMYLILCILSAYLKFVNNLKLKCTSKVSCPWYVPRKI